MYRTKRIVPLVSKKLEVFSNYRKELLYWKWYCQHSKILHKFKNLHSGEDCFIIGNGPSLNQMDLSLLNDYHTFGLNKIYLLLDKVDLNLSYHVAVNKLVIEQSISQFETLRCPSFLSYRASYKLVKKTDNFYFIYTGGPYTFNTDLSSKIHEGHTVTFVAMQIAYYMGFSRVFLIGVDHDFSVKGKPNEKQLMKGKDLNHFNPNYFANKEWQLPDIEASELAYHLARFFYNRSGRQIFDATIDGKLNIFPKIAFEEAIKQAKEKI